MRAAIYARVSTEEQLEGYSIDAQLQACRKLIADRGVSFVSASEPMDFTSSHGELMLVLFLWFARHYLTNLSAEVSKGRRGRAESGRSNANRPPFGYLRVEIDEAKSDVPNEAARSRNG